MNDNTARKLFDTEQIAVTPQKPPTTGESATPGSVEKPSRRPLERFSHDHTMMMLAVWANYYKCEDYEKSCSVVAVTANRSCIMVEPQTDLTLYPSRLIAYKYGVHQLAGATVYLTKEPAKESLKTLINAQVAKIIVLGRSSEDTTPVCETEEAGNTLKDHIQKVSSCAHRRMVLSLDHTSCIDKLKAVLDTAKEKRKEYLKVWFMGFAFIAAQRSEDPEIAVGACLVLGKEKNWERDWEKPTILSFGYNALQSGCDEVNLPQNDSEMKKYFTVHAEKNALLFRNPFIHHELKNCTLFCTMIACLDCYPYIKALEVDSYWSTHREKYRKGLDEQSKAFLKMNGDLMHLLDRTEKRTKGIQFSLSNTDSSDNDEW